MGIAANGLDDENGLSENPLPGVPRRMALWERGSNGQANSVTQSSCCIETCNACCCPAAPKTVLTCPVHSLGLRSRPKDCAVYDEDEDEDDDDGLYLGLGL